VQSSGAVRGPAKLPCDDDRHDERAQPTGRPLSGRSSGRRNDVGTCIADTVGLVDFSALALSHILITSTTRRLHSMRPRQSTSLAVFVRSAATTPNHGWQPCQHRQRRLSWVGLACAVARLWAHVSNTTWRLLVLNCSSFLLPTVPSLCVPTT
jgi:hypothetical protein